MLGDVLGNSFRRNFRIQFVREEEKVLVGVGCTYPKLHGTKPGLASNLAGMSYKHPNPSEHFFSKQEYRYKPELYPSNHQSAFLLQLSPNPQIINSDFFFLPHFTFFFFSFHP